jgi:[protein-PII] uridylyltransferase
MIDEQLQAAKATLSEAIASGADSSALARVAREVRNAIWEAARSHHASGATGSTVVHALSEAADVIVRAACEAAAAHSEDPEAFRRSVCVCALGGYGRNELSPSSDLDLCLLYRKPRTRTIEAANAFLVPFFWDAGFDSGYVFQSIPEAREVALSEPPMLTSYVLSRPVWGDSEVLAELKASIGGLDTEAGKVCFEQAMLRRNRATLAPEHAERFSPEPNLKEQAGGLRDYHAARWMLALCFGDVPLDVLAARGVISEEALLRLTEGIDFLWRVRNELHWWKGKRMDTLAYSSQEHVALAFDYGREPERAVERLMQDYYAATRAVRDFLAAAANACRQGGDHHSADDSSENGDRQIFVLQNRIHAGATDPNWFSESPPRLMRVFWESARARIPVSDATLARITAHRHLVGRDFQNNELVRRFFFAICNYADYAGKVLRQMADCGLLAAYLPEWGAVQGLVRHQSFHSFPVDEHTLRAIEALGEIPRIEGTVGRFLEKTLEHVQEPAVLVLSILFHDLGKAVEGEHVEEGVRIVEEAGKRMGWPSSTLERVSFLVRYHMLMNEVSMYRDTDDPNVVSSFARTMRSDERLRELVLLSYCDLRAVAPGVWSDWKGVLLMKLSLKTERVLSGRDMGLGEELWKSPLVTQIREAVRADLPEASGDEADERVRQHIEGFGDRYVIAFRPHEVAQHVLAMKEVEETGLVVRHVPHENTGMSEITIFAGDKKGLFASITGAFTSNGAAVKSAGLFTNQAGDVVDVFMVQDAREARPLTSRQFDAFEQTLRKVLLEDGDIQTLVDASRRRLFAILEPPAPVPTRIIFDDSSSPHDTVVDIETGDRTGLLYDIASVFSEHGINVLSARIDTDNLRVRDAFHLQKDGKPLTDPQLREVLRNELRARLEPLAAANL